MIREDLGFSPADRHENIRRAGLLTGVSAPYEAPVAAEIVVDTTRATVGDTAARLLAFLEAGAFVGTVRELS